MRRGAHYGGGKAPVPWGGRSANPRARGEESVKGADRGRVMGAAARKETAPQRARRRRSRTGKTRRLRRGRKSDRRPGRDHARVRAPTPAGAPAHLTPPPQPPLDDPLMQHRHAGHEERQGVATGAWEHREVPTRECETLTCSQGGGRGWERPEHGGTQEAGAAARPSGRHRQTGARALERPMSTPNAQKKPP